MSGDFEEVLVSRQELQNLAKILGKQISEEYAGKDLILVGVLKGGFVFLADLMREITIPVDMDFISVTSYGASTSSSGVVRIIKDIDIDITGKHVLIVEDLVDTGLTLRHLKELLHTRGPASIKLCTALDKPSRRKVDITVDFPSIEIPDRFVVGYGLDYAGYYRNLPEVYVLSPKVYGNEAKE